MVYSGKFFRRDKDIDRKEIMFIAISLLNVGCRKRDISLEI